MRFTGRDRNSDFRRISNSLSLIFGYFWNGATLSRQHQETPRPSQCSKRGTTTSTPTISRWTVSTLPTWSVSKTTHHAESWTSNKMCFCFVRCLYQRTGGHNDHTSIGWTNTQWSSSFASVSINCCSSGVWTVWGKKEWMIWTKERFEEERSAGYLQNKT